MSMDDLSSRVLCFRMLEEVYKQKAFSNLVIYQQFSNNPDIGTKNKAFISALFYGVITRSYTLDYYIDKFNTNKKTPDESVQIILRMGIWQILFAHSVPEYAAVHTSVELAKKHVHAGAARFVNGILRSVLRQKDVLNKSIDTLPFYAQYSMSKEICGMFIKWYGLEKAGQIAASLLERPRVTIRTNTLRIRPSELIDRLEKEGQTAYPSQHIDQSIEVDLTESSVFSLQSFKDGLFMVQGESAMLASIIAAPGESDQILDLCAAPGGKTCHLAELTRDRASIIAMDVNRSRLSLIEQNLERLGIRSVQTREADATCLNDDYPDYKNAFDLVVADVPCSGLGLLSKKPDIRLTMTYARVMDLLPIQKAIVEQAASCVKPGGTLVYCTCTLNPNENEKQVEAFLDNHADFERISMDAYVPQTLKAISERIAAGAKEGHVLFLPDETNCDGFYIAKMRRKK